MARAGFAKLSVGELVIVLVILAVLAAVVIPQYSRAGFDEKLAGLDASVENVRAAIAKYRVEHHGRLPGERERLLDSSLFWLQLTARTDDNGTVVDAAEANATAFGPYLSEIPANPFHRGQSWVCEGVTDPPTLSAAASYYFNLSDGSGKFWGAADLKGTPEE